MQTSTMNSLALQHHVQQLYQDLLRLENLPLYLGLYII